MHFLTRVGIGLVAHRVFYKITKHSKVSAASTALLYLLMQKADEASASEIDTEAEALPGPFFDQLTEEQINTYYQNQNDSIFIQYPGLKIWFPQVERTSSQQIAGKPISIEALLEKARG